MERNLFFLQDSLTGCFYAENGYLGSFAQAIIYTEDSFESAVYNQIKIYKFYLTAISRGAEIRLDIQKQAVERAMLSNFGIQIRKLEIDLCESTTL